MLIRLRRYLAPPVFEDREQSRIAAILYVILLTLLAAWLLLCVDDWFVRGGRNWPALFCVTVFTGGALGFTRRGQLMLPRFLTPAIVLTVVSYIIFVNQLGIHDIGMLSYPGIIVLAGLLIGQRGPLIFAGLSMAAITGLCYAEMSGLSASPFRSLATVRILSTISIILGTTAVFMEILIRNLRDSLARARRNEAALSESEETYRTLVESMQDITFAIDTGGRITFVSSQIRSLGYEPHEIVTQSVPAFVQKCIAAEDRQKVTEAFTNIGAKSSVAFKPIVFRFLTRDRRIKWMEETVNLQRDQRGTILGLNGILRDVTLQQESERTARMISEVQQALLQPCELTEIYTLVSAKVHELIGDCITITSILDETTQNFRVMAYHGIDVPIEEGLAIVGVNPLEHVYQIAKMTDEELRIYRSGKLERFPEGLCTVLGAYVPRPLCLALEKFLRIRGVYTMGFLYGSQHLGGLILLARTELGPYQHVVTELVNLASLAIYRKRAEGMISASERLLRAIVDNAPIRVFWKDTESRYLGCNTSFAQDAGFSRPEELLGKDDFQMGWRDQAAIYSADDQLVIQSNTPKLGYEEPQTTPDGRTIWLRTSKVPLHDAEGKTFGVLGIYDDITARRHAEDQIRAALREKEVLLREIHHRVKNNLQVISSLLNLQLPLLYDENDRTMFRESQQRVRTMALIHEKLYRSGDLSRIDVREYITTLVHELVASYQRPDVVLDVVVDLAAVFWTLDTAIPCGLIINELVSNALKYAFAEGAGRLTIRLNSAAKGAYELVISDNGCGLPEGFALNQLESLGLQLVQGLVEEQLGGQLTVNSQTGQGTTWRITFTESNDR